MKIYDRIEQDFFVNKNFQCPPAFGTFNGDLYQYSHIADRGDENLTICYERIVGPINEPHPKHVAKPLDPTRGFLDSTDMEQF